jgi:3-hydroxyisobutyrate dehydrogenase-like beta-hydroxyacid dehydrogenase
MAADAAPSTLGFVGLGIMGEAMALNLLKLGQPVVVWNRNAEKCSSLAAAGASVAASAADVAARADITFAMLADPAAAEAVALGPAGVVEGAFQSRAPLRTR